MSFEEIGNQFIGHYYTTLTTNRNGMIGLYTDISCLTYEGEQFMGAEQIMGKLGGLPNLTFDGNSAQIDCQPSVNEGILVLVNGTLCIDGNAEAPLKFTQTFMLQKGGAFGYYIHNEVFRLSLGWTYCQPRLQTELTANESHC